MCITVVQNRFTSRWSNYSYHIRFWWSRFEIEYNRIAIVIFANYISKFLGGNRHKKSEHYGEVNTHDEANDTSKTGNAVNMTAANGSALTSGQPGQGMPSKVTKVKNNEKTLLLSSDDEFQ